MIKGVGGESGITFEYSPDMLADILNGSIEGFIIDSAGSGAEYPIIIHGISRTLPVNTVGRLGAISVPSFEAKFKTKLIEEYLVKSTIPITIVPSHTYPIDINITDKANYAWSTLNNKNITAGSDGFSSPDTGVFDEKITGVRSSDIAGEAIKLIDADHTVIFNSDINVYKLNMDVNGGTPTINPIDFAAGALVVEPPMGSVKMTGHNLVYWVIEPSNPETVWDFATGLMPYADLTLKAIWEPSVYDIIFNGNGETSGVMARQSVVYNENIVINNNQFVKDNYTFIGWDTDPAGVNKVYKDAETVQYTFANDINLYAVWAKNPVITVEHIKEHPSGAPQTAIVPAVSVNGQPSETYQTTATNDANYVLIRVEEYLDGSVTPIQRPLADYTATFPEYEKETIIKYIYLEKVDITLEKNVAAPGVFDPTTETFVFEIWGTEAGSTVATYPVMVNNTSGSTLITGLTAGQDYYIKEVVANPNASSYMFYEFINAVYDSTEDAYKFTAPNTSAEALTVTANNKYNTSGVSVRKVIANNDGNLINASDTFTILVENADQGYSQTFTLASGETTNINGLIVGKTYTISEETPLPTGYKYESITSDKLALSTSDNIKYTFTAPNSNVSLADALITVTNSVAFNTNVTINKGMVAPDVLLNPTDTFDFYLWKDGDTKPATPNITSIDAANKALSDFSGVTLIEGVTYHIEEASKMGYLLASITDSGGGNTASGAHSFVVPVGGGALNITANNKHHIVDGKVEVTKKLPTGQNPYDANDQFTITIGRVASDGSVVNAVNHLIKVNETLTIDGLIAGQKYSIVESNIPTGYIFKSIGVGGANDAEINDFEFIAPTSGTAAVQQYVVRNALNLGEVIVRKNYGTSSKLRDDDKFTFKVWKQSAAIGTATTEEIDMAVKDSVSLSGLIGTEQYYIAEDAVTSMGYKLVQVLDNGGAVITPINIGSVSAYPFTAPTASEGTITLIFSNERDILNPAAINAGKKLAAGSVVLNAADSFKLSVQRINAANQPTADAPIIVDIKPAAGGGLGTKINVAGLVAGEKYLVSEIAPVTTGYELSAITATGLTLTETPAGSGKYTFTAPSSSTAPDSHTFEVENKNKIIPLGSLTLNKKMISGVNPLNPTDKFDFYIWRDGETKPAIATITNVDFTMNASLPNLIAGQKYYIEEESYTGYSLDKMVAATGITITHESGNVYSFVAPSATPASPISITITNKRGSINAVNISKTIAAPLNPADTFQFKVWRNGDPASSAVTITASASGSVVQINNLVPGEEYFIEEQGKIGYKFIDMTGNGVALDSGNIYKFTVPTTTATPVAIVAKNEVRLLSGMVSLSKKTVSGTVLKAGADQFEFIVWRDGTAKPTVATHTAGANGASVAVDNVVEGQKYYIEELSRVGYILKDMTIGGVALSKDSVGYFFTVPVATGSPVAISVTNDYAYMDSVTVEKLIAGSKAPLKPTDTFTIKVWKAGDAESTAKTYVLKAAGAPQAITGLVAGESYHIKEEALNGYILNSILVNNVALTETAQGSGIYLLVMSDNPTVKTVVKLNNDYNYLSNGTVSLSNDMLAGEEPLNPSDSFGFYIWRDGDKKTAAPNYSIKPDGSVVSLNNIIAGQKYYIEQKHFAGYTLDSITIGGTSLSKDGNGYYFTAPLNGSTSLVIEAVNKIHYLQDGVISLKKALKAEQDPIATSDTFEVNIKRNGANSSDSYSLVINGANVSAKGLIAGQKYYISEQAVDYYRFLRFDSPSLPIASDSGGFYFISPTSDSAKHTITVVNELDIIKDGKVKLLKVMGYDGDVDFNFDDDDKNDSNVQQKPYSYQDKFKFFVWRDGTTKPYKPNYDTIIGHKKAIDVTELIGGFKYYVEEETKLGYINAGFKINGQELAKDANGYYFYAPKSLEDGVLIEATNVLAKLPEDVLLFEAVMEDGYTPVNEKERFNMILQARNARYFMDDLNVKLRLNDDRTGVQPVVSDQYYYLLDGENPGYQLVSVLINGFEVEKDDVGFFFKAPRNGVNTVITAKYILSDKAYNLGLGNAIDVTKYMDGEIGGTTAFDEEFFRLVLKSDDFEIVGKISSLTGEFVWDVNKNTEFPIGVYKVEEVIGEDSIFSTHKIEIFVDGVQLEDSSEFELTGKEKDIKIDIYNVSYDISNGLKVPNAGGFPVQLLVIAIGAVLLVVGIILGIVRKKKNEK